YTGAHSIAANTALPQWLPSRKGGAMQKFRVFLFLTAVCLTSVAATQALRACSAWVLWINDGWDARNARTSAIRAKWDWHSAYESKSECYDLGIKYLRGELILAQSDPETATSKLLGELLQIRNTKTGTVTYTTFDCLPDTLDPRR